MIGLPETTEVDCRVPKKKLCENLSVPPALKRMLTDKVQAVYWRNKVDKDTMNLAAGNAVEEIEVFEVKLNEQEIDETVVRLMDQGIPHHNVFLLEYDGKYQAWIAYRENAPSGTKAFKAGTCYRTGWLAESELPLKADGLSVDQVYENFVRQIAGDALRFGEETAEPLKKSVERDARRRELEKRIETLQTKVRREKQLNKQVQLNVELKKLKSGLEKVVHGKDENGNARHDGAERR